MIVQKHIGQWIQHINGKGQTEKRRPHRIRELRNVKMMQYGPHANNERKSNVSKTELFFQIKRIPPSPTKSAEKKEEETEEVPYEFQADWLTHKTITTTRKTCYYVIQSWFSKKERYKEVISKKKMLKENISHCYNEFNYDEETSMKQFQY